MSEPRIVIERSGVVARIFFDNPHAHNALTLGMWQDLADAARDVTADSTIRVVVFRGIGGKAFVSGTDIAGFAGFTDGADGISYEKRMDASLRTLDAIPATTVAVVEGWCVGGGLNIASACDFRIATPEARFGSPIGRTLGNCLSTLSVARIGAAIGVAMAKRMVLLGEIVTADALVANGFLLDVVARDALEARVDALCERASENAPLTTRACKEVMRRLTLDDLPDAADVIGKVYGSEDFRRGVETFLGGTKTLPDWTGQ